MRTATNFPVRFLGLAAATSLALLFATGCNLLNSKTPQTTTTTTTATAEVSVTPPSAQIRAGDRLQFAATVTGISDQTVAWSVNGIAGGNSTVGSISASGLYQSPASIPSPNSVQVQATSASQTSAASSSTVTLDNPIPVVTSCVPNALPIGNFTLSVTGKNFVNGAVVVFGTQFLTTTFVSSTQLTATGTASTPSSSPIQVTVTNPDPGSASSSALLVTVQPLNAGVVARFLEQSTWGPTPQLIAHVQQIGFQAFLNEQFAATNSTYPAPGPNDDMSVVQNRFFVNALTGQDQLRQRVAFALSQIMVASAAKVNNPSAFVLWNTMFQNDAFGNFSTLLTDVTLSPVMGNYLDMVNNDKTASGLKPNENYAREVLQLFTIGLSELNPDGTPQLDGTGNPVPTYTQDTIDGFARVFTGWTYPTQPGQSGHFWNPEFYGGPMIPFDNHHDSASTKLLLNGATLQAGGTAQADMTAALQNIFSHPNVGPFISQQLIQHLVTSNPSPAYVGRVAAVFNDNGSGVRGDLKAVVTAILTDEEARRGDDPSQVQANDGHLKEPLLFMINMLRAVNASTDGSSLSDYASNMKQTPFFSPSVFNFYPPNFVIQGSTLLGPEFAILNTSTSIARINFVNDLVYNTIGTTTTDISAFVGLAGTPDQLVDTMASVMLHSNMSTDMRNTLISTITPLTDNTRRTKSALYLIGSSSQFQVEH
jgi:uncharacterized protein (DUF1800 family)